MSVELVSIKLGYSVVLQLSLSHNSALALVIVPGVLGPLGTLVQPDVTAVSRNEYAIVVAVVNCTPLEIAEVPTMIKSGSKVAILVLALALLLILLVLGQTGIAGPSVMQIVVEVYKPDLDTVFVHQLLPSNLGISAEGLEA